MPYVLALIFVGYHYWKDLPKRILFFSTKKIQEKELIGKDVCGALLTDMHISAKF